MLIIKSLKPVVGTRASILTDSYLEAYEVRFRSPIFHRALFYLYKVTREEVRVCKGPAQGIISAPSLSLLAYCIEYNISVTHFSLQ